MLSLLSLVVILEAEEGPTADRGEKSHDFFSPDQNLGLTRRIPEEGSIWAKRPIGHQGRAGWVSRAAELA